MSVFASPIDPDLPANWAELANLQGNILSAHARDFTTLVLFRFQQDQTAARALVRRIAEQVTSAGRQRQTYLDWKKHSIVEPTFYGFFLTAGGYAALGVNSVAAGLPTADAADRFSSGMRAGESHLTPPNGGLNWELEYLDGGIHGAVMIAEWQKGRGEAALTALVNDPVWTAAVEWKHVERGQAYRNEKRQRIEHFGYVDGISQPLFMTDEIDAAKTREGAFTKWAPDQYSASDLVLHPVSYVESAGSAPVQRTGFGSYLVYRKLEQNVAGFAEFSEQLAKTINSDVEFAGASLVGRFRDGTALTLHDAPMGEPMRNDFDYSSDPGTRCPFHAHIRKANQRETPRNVRKQMVRRGIPYGARALLPDGSMDMTKMPDQGVGLLFLAFVRNIESQFEVAQGTWMNSDFGSTNYSTADPVAGHSALAAIPPLQFRQQWDQAQTEPQRRVGFANFVTPRGGAYFFAPPIGFMKSLI